MLFNGGRLTLIIVITPKSRQFRELKKSKLLIISGLDFLSVGITGLEPATSRPPEATQLALNPVDNHHFSNYRKGESDVFRDGFHHVGLKFNISSSRMIPMESVQSYEILSILQSIHNIFVAEQHIFKEITILQLIISEIGDKNEKGDITRLFYELCPRYKYGSLNGLAILLRLVLTNPD